VNRKRLLLLREQEMFPDPQSLFAMPAIMKGHSPFKGNVATPGSKGKQCQKLEGMIIGLPWPDDRI
jgi:hypothetical protein